MFYSIGMNDIKISITSIKVSVAEIVFFQHATERANTRVFLKLISKLVNLANSGNLIIHDLGSI